MFLGMKKYVVVESDVKKSLKKGEIVEAIMSKMEEDEKARKEMLSREFYKIYEEIMDSEEQMMIDKELGLELSET